MGKGKGKGHGGGGSGGNGSSRKTSSKTHQETLVDELTNAIDEAEAVLNEKYTFAHSIKDLFLSLTTPLGEIISILLLIAAYVVSEKVHYLVEGILLLLFLVGNVAFYVWDYFLSHFFMVRRARSHVSAYVRRGYRDSTRFPTNPGEVALKTSSTWHFTFSNLLIPGDQVLIPKSAHIPKGAHPSDISTTPTSTTNITPAPSASPGGTGTSTSNNKRLKHAWLRSYDIGEAPGVTQLRGAFSAQRPGTRLEGQVLRVREAYAAGAWVFFLLSVAIGVVRHLGQNHELSGSVLAQPAYVFVGSGLVFFPYIPWAVVEAYCNARLQSAFFMLQKRSYKEHNRMARECADEDSSSSEDGTSPSSLSSSPSTSPVSPRHGRRGGGGGGGGGGDAGGRGSGGSRRLHRLRSSMEFDDVDGLPDPKSREEVDDAGRVRVPFKLLWKHFRVLLLDKSPCVRRSTRAFQTLGSVTTCVFVNKDATLIEPLPQPECVYLPSPAPKGTRLNLSTHVAKDSRISVNFDDTDWKKYIPVLKPLGLANLIYRPLCCPETDGFLSSHICMGEMPDAVADQAIHASGGHNHNHDHECCDDYEHGGGSGRAKRCGAAAENRHWKEAFVLMSQNYSRPYSRCMCALSTEIGFSESVARHFKRVKEIHTYASIPQTMVQDVSQEVLTREPPYMMSVAIRYFEQQQQQQQQEEGGNSKQNYSLQMFSKGNLFVLLGHCSSLWDGKRIVKLTPDIRNQIVAEYSKLSDSYNIVAFAYKPIQKQHAHIFDGEGTIIDVRVASVNKTTFGAKASATDKRMVKDCIKLEGNESSSSSSSSSSSEDDLRKGRKSDKPSKNLLKKTKIIKNDNDDEEEEEEQIRKGREAQKSRKEMEEIQTDQIFIGMTALRNIPKKGTSTVINSLDHAGIRFMYFSTEDEHRSVFMAQKLGLETDWNCLISLKDLVPGQSKYMDGPAKLPRGISNIRRHIAKVDPIPLRVPVFSDCTPESSAKMIQILQENGENVLCVGNCLEERSAQAFAQANIAIAMQPRPARCTQQGPPTVREDELLSSHTFVKHSSLGCLSADLTSLPCTFVMHQLTDFKTLGDLLCESRHLLGNTSKALLYAFALVLVLGIASALSACAFAPPIFNGYQMLWASAVTIPLLAGCLLTGTLDDDIMSRLTPKSQLDTSYLRHTCALVTSQVVPTLLTCVLTFLFTLKNVWGAGWRAIFSPKAVGLDAPPEGPLLYAQNFALLAYALCALVAMFVLARPGPSFSSFFALMKLNGPQNVAKAAAVLVQAAFFAVSLAAVDGFALFDRVSWQPWVVIVAGLVVSFVAGVICLVKYKKWWNDYQLDLKLEFETKLGMYSPVAQSP